MRFPDGEMTKQEAIGTIITSDKNIFAHINRKCYLVTTEWVRTSRAKHFMWHCMKSWWVTGPGQHLSWITSVHPSRGDHLLDMTHKVTHHGWDDITDNRAWHTRWHTIEGMTRKATHNEGHDTQGDTQLRSWHTMESMTQKVTYNGGHYTQGDTQWRAWHIRWHTMEGMVWGHDRG